MRFFIVAVVLAFGLSGTANATPISQVDVITLGGGAWTGDQWTLQLASPVIATVTYTVTDADVVGCNICNTTAHWGAAINSDPIMGSFLTATYEIWDGVSPVPPSVITLTADFPGQPFSASVSVSGPCDPFGCEPLTVSIVTQTKASVPEPSTLPLLLTGLAGFAALRRRRSNIVSIAV